jgi:hypothetical protein
MEKKHVFAILVLMSAIAMSTVASAAPSGSNLHGEYSLIGTRICVQNSATNSDFVVPNYQFLPQDKGGIGGTTRTAHYNGILRLYGDGTGQFSNKALQINHNATAAGNFPSGGWTDICDVNYQAQAGEDGAIRLDFVNCVSATLWPNPPGVTVVSSSDSGPVSVTVSANGDTLLMSNVGSEADVETTWTCGIDGSSGQPDCNIQINKFYRICARSFTAIRLSPQP